ncbi:unnamed protein product, partial [Ectocarpus sp. 6 AP-2014]
MHEKHSRKRRLTTCFRGRMIPTINVSTGWSAWTLTKLTLPLRLVRLSGDEAERQAEAARERVRKLSCGTVGGDPFVKIPTLHTVLCYAQDREWPHASRTTYWERYIATVRTGAKPNCVQLLAADLREDFLEWVEIHGNPPVRVSQNTTLRASYSGSDDVGGIDDILWDQPVDGATGDD